MPEILTRMSFPKSFDAAAIIPIPETLVDNARKKKKKKKRRRRRRRRKKKKDFRPISSFIIDTTYKTTHWETASGNRLKSSYTRIKSDSSPGRKHVTIFGNR